MADEKFEPGKMNIEAQEKTFEGFMRWVTNGAIIIVLFLILLAIVGA